MSWSAWRRNCNTWYSDLLPQQQVHKVFACHGIKTDKKTQFGSNTACNWKLPAQVIIPPILFFLQSMRHYTYTIYRVLLVMTLVIGFRVKTLCNRLSISNIFFMLNALENAGHLEAKSKSCISFHLNIQRHIQGLGAVYNSRTKNYTPIQLMTEALFSFWSLILSHELLNSI